MKHALIPQRRWWTPAEYRFGGNFAFSEEKEGGKR